MKSIKIYFAHRLQSISALLENTSASCDSETVNQLRIKIKKLKAFLKIVKFCSKDITLKKYFQPYKIIFDKAGEVRELDIINTVVEAHLPKSTMPHYSNYLKKITTKECALFFTLLQKHPVKYASAMHKEILPTLGRIMPKTSSQYLNRLYKQLHISSDKKKYGQCNAAA